MNTFRLNGEKWDDFGEDFYTTDANVDSSIQFLDEAVDSEKPFFHYVAFNAPHYPLQAPKEDIQKYAGRYDAGWEVKVGPNYRRPCVETSVDWIDGSNPSVLRQAEKTSDWWRVFNDPVLEQLVQAAYQQNLTLRAAGLRVLQARLQREVSQRNLWPQSQEAFGQYATNLLGRLGVRLPIKFKLAGTP
ncbi:MAG: sulfatase-like hydrolase/transferase [Planctomycetota bacterium]